MNFLTKNDGSGRKLRPVQIEALTWLQDNWNNAEAFVLQIPVGGGKSLLAKSIANATNGHIITPSNILVNQYRDVYPTTNFLQGKSHYTCSSGLSCEDWTGPVLEQKPCPNCPYIECKKKALQGQQTIFNPLSLYYAALNKEWRTPNTLIVDECFPGTQTVATSEGNITLHTIHKRVQAGETISVKSFNEQLKTFEWKRVTRSWKKQTKKSSVKLVFGVKTLVCTEDHQLLTSSGWTSAKNLTAGSAVVGYTDTSRSTRSLSEDQRQLVYGSMLGDGYIDWRNKTKTFFRLAFTQGEDQLDYLKWKAGFFGLSAFRKSKSGYGDKTVYQTATRGLHDLSINWEGLLNNIDARGLAIWFMDDGTLAKHPTQGHLQGVTLHTNAFTYKENTELQSMLQNRFGVTFTIAKTKQYYYLRANKEQGDRFLNIIESYVPEAMNHKSRPNRIPYAWFPDSYSPMHYEMLFVDPQPVATAEYVYDLEVEDNHNFLCTFHKRTNVGVVAHNCHQLGGMISMLSGTRLRRSMYNFTEETTNELALLPWLDRQLVQLAKLSIYYGKDKKRLKEIVEELERLRLVKLGIEHDAANYAIWIERGTFRGKADQFLCIKPVRPPRKIVRGFLDAKKVVLLSGTTTPADVFDLVGDRRTLSIDLPSPIPKENRTVIYKPTSFPMNMSTDPKRIVQAIEAIIADNPGLNTIIHVSYSISKRLQPHFTVPNLIFNDAENKSKKLLQFTTHGGIFLAAGCSEGLDLRGDLCRLNIIPKLLYPNLGDPVVQKRKSLEDGDAWYASETLKTLVQQTGRSTRSETDYSKIYVLDPGFARLFRQHKGSLPQSFTDSISWSGR